MYSAPKESEREEMAALLREMASRIEAMEPDTVPAIRWKVIQARVRGAHFAVMK